jgi:putative flippase GtrA
MTDGSETVRERLAPLFSGVRIGQFVSVGAVGAVCDTALTLTLELQFGVQPLLAKFVGAEAAILVMFLINEYWTFADEGAVGAWSFLRRLGTSNLVRAGGLVVQLVVYWLIRDLPITASIAGFQLWKVGAIGVAIGAAVIVNYLAESLLTWRVLQ